MRNARADLRLASPIGGSIVIISGLTNPELLKFRSRALRALRTPSPRPNASGGRRDPPRLYGNARVRRGFRSGICSRDAWS